MSESELIGLWTLVEAKREYVDTSEVVDLYGPDPAGYLLLAPGGRMMALITASARSASGDAAGLFGELMAYSGTYRVEGNRWVTDVDVAWHPDWIGTQQEREFRIVDGELHIRAMAQEHPSRPGRVGRGLLRWRRDDALTAR